MKDWVAVIKQAHALGIPTTSTIMYGHIETSRHKAEHIDLLRDIQKETHGFTEFVPLSFVHTEAPMYNRKTIPKIRPGADGNEVIKMHAVARIMLNNHIPNIQVSWVKEGARMSQLLLAAGVNDFGGTLINESISTARRCTAWPADETKRDPQADKSRRQDTSTALYYLSDTEGVC